MLWPKICVRYGARVQNCASLLHNSRVCLKSSLLYSWPIDYNLGQVLLQDTVIVTKNLTEEGTEKRQWEVCHRCCIVSKQILFKTVVLAITGRGCI